MTISANEIKTRGVSVFDNLLNKFDGNIVFALAAYNGGQLNVKKWLERSSDKNDIDEFISAINYGETQIYVKRVLASYKKYKEIYSIIKL